MVHELDEQFKEVWCPCKVQLFTVTDPLEKFLQEEDGRGLGQFTSLNIEAHEFNRVSKLLPKTCRLWKEALLYKQSHNLGALAYIVSIDVQEQLIFESD